MIYRYRIKILEVHCQSIIDMCSQALSRSAPCALKVLTTLSSFYNCQLLCRYSTGMIQNESDISDSEKSPRGGFAKAFENYTKAANKNEDVKEESFAALLRKSKIIDVSYCKKIYLSEGMTLIFFLK